MNREIKFRAYHGEPGSGSMKYSVGVHPFMIFRLSDHDLLDADEKYDDNTGNLVVTPNAYNVMQYTGLKDKNGKEIYEGDIVKTETDKPMVVSWNKKFASFCLDRDGWMYSHWFGESCEPENIEIIGNIHQNPELLKGGKHGE